MRNKAEPDFQNTVPDRPRTCNRRAGSLSQKPAASEPETAFPTRLHCGPGNAHLRRCRRYSYHPEWQSRVVQLRASLDEQVRRPEPDANLLSQSVNAAQIAFIFPGQPFVRHEVGVLQRCRSRKRRFQRAHILLYGFGIKRWRESRICFGRDVDCGLLQIDAFYLTVKRLAQSRQQGMKSFLNPRIPAF